MLHRHLAWWRYSQVSGNRSLVGRAFSKSEHPSATPSAKIARKRKGSTFVLAPTERRVYRRGRRPSAQSLWIRGLYGSRQPLTPHERWLLDGNLEFLLLQHPNAPSGRLPHRPLLLFGAMFLTVALTSSQPEKIVMRAIQPKCLDFALSQFYRSMHWNNGAQCG